MKHYFLPIAFGVMAATGFYFLGRIIGLTQEASLFGAIIGFLVGIPNIRRIAQISKDAAE